MCVRVFIGVSAHMCISIYVCTVFLKKKYLTTVSVNPTSFIIYKGDKNRRKNCESK
jgi:hypothetical protein